ncbi:MAG: hypothetical protein FWF77_02535, partial [Defluviitaleaceae bacterium]|nr:hypothetical protein [Defluviitaleaceae bacterium]
AGSNFPAHEKARQARSGHRGHMSKSAHSLEAGSNFPAHEKTANEIAAELEAVFRNSVSG